MNYVPEKGLFEVETPVVARLVADLLAMRATTANAGNRRTLFAAMDLLLSERSADATGSPPAARIWHAPGRSVRLDRLRLANWKAFERADISIPHVTADRPVVVVGGSNGFGKSSILEAFALGLFGRKAISDVGFLIHAGGGRGEHRRAYRSLLERNLHRSERARGEGMCSVILDFATDEGPVSVERKWYFEEDGRFVEDEEELLLRVGEDRQLVATPAGVSAAEWYEEEIERRIMPSGLAPFFVFDGEQVERWAERRLTDQVRSAVARMLGIDSLSGLVQDLNAFARDRERDTATEAATSGQYGVAEFEAVENELHTVTGQLMAVGATLTALRAERELILGKVSALSGGSHADLQQILEAEHRHSAEQVTQRRELVSLMAEHGPTLLAGKGLLGRTADAIEAAPGHRAAHFSPDEIELLWGRFASAEPPLDAEDASRLRARFTEAMSESASEGSADSHRHLDRSSRRLVVARLRSASADGCALIDAALAEAVETGERIRAAKGAAFERERRSAELARARQELTVASAAIEAAESERGSLGRHADALRLRIEPLREDAIRRESRLRDSAPRLRAARMARLLAGSIDSHLTAIAEGEHRRLGDEVTRSFRTLSHKDQLARIDIGADGSVTLLDASGRDVTDYRLSAGESQLFALALISAVGSIVGDRLPLVVDTPLSRLDTRHRESVLDMLARRRAQTILLTQPEEITARHLARLEPVLGAAMHLVHSVDPLSGVGTSRIEAGYEPEEATTSNAKETYLRLSA